jgi:hypothetical protein
MLRCQHSQSLLLKTTYTLFGIVVRVNQPAQSIISRRAVITFSVTCVFMRTNLGLPPALNVATTLYVALSPFASVAAKDQLKTNHTLFGIVGKINQPTRTIISRRFVITTSYESSCGPIWAGCHHLPHRVQRCQHPHTPLLKTNYTLFGIGQRHSSKSWLTSLLYFISVYPCLVHPDS